MINRSGISLLVVGVSLALGLGVNCARKKDKSQKRANDRQDEELVKLDEDQQRIRKEQDDAVKRLQEENSKLRGDLSSMESRRRSDAAASAASRAALEKKLREESKKDDKALDVRLSDEINYVSWESFLNNEERIEDINKLRAGLKAEERKRIISDVIIASAVVEVDRNSRDRDTENRENTDRVERESRERDAENRANTNRVERESRERDAAINRRVTKLREDTESELKRFYNHFNSKIADLNDKLSSEITELRMDVCSNAAAISMNADNIDTNSDLLKATNDKIDGYYKELTNSIKREVTTLQNQINKTKSDLKNLRNEGEKIVKAHTNRLNMLTKAKEEAFNRIGKTSKALSKVKKQLAKLQKEVERLAKDSKGLVGRVDSLEAGHRAHQIVFQKRVAEVEAAFKSFADAYGIVNVKLYKKVKPLLDVAFSTERSAEERLNARLSIKSVIDSELKKLIERAAVKAPKPRRDYSEGSRAPAPPLPTNG